ncbi:hypothetical protein HDU76_009374 [Blyttiomyces sp. JEL0837]|nr:hypothetical protein HDU76_009374 [Blyttiomyces sp. JEL0837]
MGNLVPQQVNLWMGAAPREGVSSGLHHDFADNLYVLLRGKKTFTIFPPSDAEKLYVNGPLHKVHHNGFIQYADRNVRADGAYVYNVARWKVQNALDAVKEAVDLKDKKAEKEARKELDSAMMELMDVENEEEIDEEIGEDDEDMEEDDEDDEEDEDDQETPEIEEIDEEDYLRGLKTKKRGNKMYFVEDEDDEDEDEQENDDDDDDEDDEDDGEDDGYLIPDEPASFSVVDTETLHSDEIPEEFSLLEHATKITFNVKKGEMLYLPASWFHEVRSYPDVEGKKPGLHMAFNYWFHPPTTDDFDEPYEDNYWEEKFQPIEELVEKAGDDVDEEEAEFMINVPTKGEKGKGYMKPGAWFVRDLRDGTFLGEAPNATISPFGF